MKLFVCMCAVFAIANAGFLGIGGGGNGNGNDHGHRHVHSAPAKLIKLKVINEHHAPHVVKFIHPQPSVGFVGGHVLVPSPQVVKVIHQKPPLVVDHAAPHVIKLIHQEPIHSHGDHSHVVAPQVINVVHQKAESSGSALVGGYNFSPALVAPAPAPVPQVINVVHHQSSVGNSVVPAHVHETVSPKVIKVIHQNAISSGAVIQQHNAPPKIIRVIHEQAQSFAQAGSLPSAPKTAYLPPVLAPAPAFTSPVLHHHASVSAEPVPVSAHIPAQSYGYH